MSILKITTENTSTPFKILKSGFNELQLFRDCLLFTKKGFRETPTSDHFWVDDEIIGSVMVPVTGGYNEGWFLVNREGSLVRIHWWDHPRFEDFESESFKKRGIPRDVHIHRYHLWNDLVLKAQPIRQVIL